MDFTKKKPVLSSVSSLLWYRNLTHSHGILDLNERAQHSHFVSSIFTVIKDYSFVVTLLPTQGDFILTLLFHSLIKNPADRADLKMLMVLVVFFPFLVAIDDELIQSNPFILKTSHYIHILNAAMFVIIYPIVSHMSGSTVVTFLL